MLVLYSYEGFRDYLKAGWQGLILILYISIHVLS